MSDSKQPVNVGFNYVDVAGDAYKGYINLFFDDVIISLVHRDVAKRIKEVAAPRYRVPSETDIEV